MSDFTQEEIKLLSNKDWRLNNLYYIVNKQKKKQLFQMNKAQRVLHESTERFQDILKARQLGISTYKLLDYFDDACFGVNQTVCILAHEQDAIKKLFRIVRFAYDNLHPTVKPVLDRGGGSKYELYFPEINSRIYCDLESRGDTISRLHISEYAFVKNRDSVLATIDAVPIESGKITRETTPNGFNHFYEEWNDELSVFKQFFFPWYFMGMYKYPTQKIKTYTDEERKLIDAAKRLYDISLSDEEIAWRRFKIRQKKGKEHFLQEYAEDDQTCFLLSGKCVMDKYILQEMINGLPKPLSDDGELKIFKEFQEDTDYTIGVDVAEGVGSDFSVATVIERDTLEQVAIYSSNEIKPLDFAYKILEVAALYSNNNQSPFIAVERNNHGHTVLGKLTELKSQKESGTLNPSDVEKYKYLSTVKYPSLFYGPDKRAGWVTNKVTRPIMIDTFIDGVENYNVILNDAKTIRECMTLISNKGKIEAEQGCHDDKVIAMSIAVAVSVKKKQTRNIRITGL